MFQSRKRTYRFLAVLLTIALIGLPSSMQAAIGDPIMVTKVIGNWTSTIGGNDVEGVGTNLIKWGDDDFSTTQKSSYAFDANAVPFSVELDTLFGAGEFVHTNNAIPLGTSITGAVLNLNLDLKIGSTDITDLDFVYDFDHNETPNVAGTCPVGSISVCDDIITITNVSPFFRTFIVDNVEYRLSVLGLEAEGQIFTSALTAEGFENFANVALIIEARELPIPEPSTYMILGSALLGFMLLARKRELTKKV